MFAAPVSQLESIAFEFLAPAPMRLLVSDRTGVATVFSTFIKFSLLEHHGVLGSAFPEFHASGATSK